jgi:hypothetical protein
MGAPVIVDHRLFLDHFNGIHRAIAHAIPAADAFILVNVHWLKSTFFDRSLSDILFSATPIYRPRPRSGGEGPGRGGIISNLKEFPPVLHSFRLKHHCSKILISYNLYFSEILNV